MGWPTSSGTGHPCVCGEQPLNDLPAPIEDSRDLSGSLKTCTRHTVNEDPSGGAAAVGEAVDVEGSGGAVFSLPSLCFVAAIGPGCRGLVVVSYGPQQPD